MLLIETVTIVIPVFLVISLGALLKKTGLLDDQFLHRTNRLVYVIFLPLLLFYKISKAEFAAFFNPALIAGSMLAILLAFALSFSFSTLRRYSAPTKGSFCQGTFRGNLAYIGLAISLNAYGETGLTNAGILMGFLVPVLNLFAILSLLLPQPGTQGRNRLTWLRKILLDPLILASFLGIGWSFLKIPMPLILDRALGITAGLTLPLALIAIGGSFSLQRLKGDLQLAGLASIIKLIGLPLLAAGILVIFGVTGTDLGIGIILAGTPAATATYIMAHQLKGDAELAGSIVMMSTLGSAFSYTLMLLIFKGTGLL
ncbi:AEC family transporter [Pelobacter seleniigenes]|uniref:AEC family transporter n=1 Tax=Pelobacter seleniigenes TaxID=407188 RepID=UPI0004A6D1E8|nr:AEC family transporter [Pelobacter seleniigenes]